MIWPSALRDLKYRSDARSVIGGSVINLIAVKRRITPQVVPVRCVDHGLVLEHRVRSFDPGDHVPRLDVAQGVGDCELAAAPQGLRAKITACGRLLERSKVSMACLEQLLGFIEADPSFNSHTIRCLAGLWLRDVKVFSAPGPLHDLEGIARGSGLVHQDRRRRSLLRGNLILVRPPPVIRHRPALEYGRVQLRGVFGVHNRRIVDQHDQRLAAHIEPLVVIPAVFRSHHSVSHEHDVGFPNLDLLGHPP